MSRNQRTLKTESSVSGAGLHTGQTVTLRLKPAPAGSGVVFRRVDLDGRPEIRASLDTVKESLRRTALVFGGTVEVHTIEHLMSAFLMLGVDNAVVEIDGLEAPGLDGSAAAFVQCIDACGIEEQDAPREEIVVRRPFGLEGAHDSSITVLPHSGLKISYTLDYRPDLDVQFASLDMNERCYRDAVAGARTFCMESEVDALKKLGLGKGASYENTLVVKKGAPVNNRLRFPDEYVRHKILDLVGDLALLGSDLRGHVIAVKSGHDLNRRFAARLREESYWSWIEELIAGPPAVDARAILRYLPHRYPMLLLDKIVHLDLQKRGIGVKNVTANENFFTGHFPETPVMPGVLICEALAQIGCTVMVGEHDPKRIAFLSGMDEVKLRRPVVPGDQLVLMADMVKIRSRLGIMQGRAYVNRELVAEAILKCMLVDA